MRTVTVHILFIDVHKRYIYVKKVASSGRRRAPGRERPGPAGCKANAAPHGGPRKFRLPSITGYYVTIFQPHQAPKSMASGKLTFDERVVAHRVAEDTTYTVHIR